MIATASTVAAEGVAPFADQAEQTRFAIPASKNKSGNCCAGGATNRANLRRTKGAVERVTKGHWAKWRLNPI